MLIPVLPELIHAYDIRADYWFLYSVTTDGVQQRGDYTISIASDDIYVNDGTTRITLFGNSNLFSMCGKCGVISVFNFKPAEPLTAMMIFTSGMDVSLSGYKSINNIAARVLAIYYDFMIPLLNSFKVCMTIAR